MMQEGALSVPKIAAPTYFLWGAHDPVLRYDFSDKLDEYFSDFTLERAEEGGHFAHFEVPELGQSADAGVFWQGAEVSFVILAGSPGIAMRFAHASRG